uniref:Uncharacterized protein LOC111133883 isoform X2 n=1 Tax=Crassostrea virginica TaxID=6565 RepID=A0A8B8EDW9_CRAVI|nr:uncharacterized protein LOC111133883 isoform X2 [Crassostrea virginica]
MRRLLLILTALSSAASISLDWTKSMNVCKKFGKGPASVTHEVKPGERIWLGRAKYEFDWGAVFLRIERVDKNRTRHVCDTSNMKNCEFCATDEWKLNLDVMKKAIDCLKPNTSYIVANFTDIQELPEPQSCLSKNDSGTADGLCSESFEDGCDHQDSAICRGHLLLNIIVALLCMSLLRVEKRHQ